MVRRLRTQGGIVFTLLLILAACSPGRRGSPSADIPSSYQLVEAEGVAFAVPEGWMVAPDDLPEPTVLPESSGLLTAAWGDYEDGVPHLVHLRWYGEAESVEDLRRLLANDAPGGDSVSDAAESVSVLGAQEAVRLSGSHRAEMGPTVDGPPLDWVSDHLLVVAADAGGYVMTISTARDRDDPALRTSILDTFHVR